MNKHKMKEAKKEEGEEKRHKGRIISRRGGKETQEETVR